MNSSPTPSYDRPGLNQILKDDWVFTELLRMRQFCFVLRDAANLALEMARPNISISMEGSSTLSVELSHKATSNEERQIIDEAVKERIRLDAANDRNKERGAFFEKFATEFHRRNKIHGFPKHFLNRALNTHQNTVTPSTSMPLNPAGPEQWPFPLDDYRGAVVDEPLPILPAAPMQEEAALWNWWDLIEMDSENRMPSPEVTGHIR
jgi:hypothetical protein